MGSLSIRMVNSLSVLGKVKEGKVWLGCFLMIELGDDLVILIPLVSLLQS